MKSICGSLIFLMAFFSCQPKVAQKVTFPEISISESPNGVVKLPENVPDMIKNIFVKYTKYIAPNGRPIHFLAQDAWTDDQILHAKDVLQHILTDHPGSEYGNDKTMIANTMADNKAAMVLFNNTDEMDQAFNRGLENLDLSMQDLRSNESPAVGDKDYMNHITRDASYEEVWHLVHDYGVVPTLPKMIAEMRKSNDEAAKKGWVGWPEEEPENHPNEYVGALIDNYYDLWAVDPQLYEAHDYRPGPEGTTHFGSYFANSREKMKEKDPLGFAVIEKFFRPYLTYTAQLPNDFSGTFSMTLDETKPYTYKSQHLVNVTLTGSNSADLVGNARANRLKGNAGDNRFTGHSGNDEIDGGAGNDTVVFSGRVEAYEINTKDGITTVSDNTPDRDAVDTLTNIEILEFSDQKIQIEN